MESNDCKNLGHADTCILIAEQAARRMYDTYIKRDIEEIVQSRENSVQENTDKIDRVLNDYLLEIKIKKKFIPITLVLFAILHLIAYFLILN